MKEISGSAPTGSKPLISAKEARKKLSVASDGLSDEQVQNIVREMELLANMSICAFIAEGPTMNKSLDKGKVLDEDSR